MARFQQNASTNIDAQLRSSLDSREVATERNRMDNMDSTPDIENNYNYQI